MASEPRIRVILQARISSSRLPAKAMLTLAGVPACVLAAQRAANAGHDVVIATSTHEADDVIAWAAERHGVRVFRGSLEDPLQRFVGATTDLGDDDIGVRLTADNVVPDGPLIQAAVDTLRRSGAVYHHVSHETLDAPYGVSVEVMTVGVLRRADAAATDAADREHVTPWIRRAIGYPTPSTPSTRMGRCTIDNVDDYLVAVRVLDGIPDPVSAPWALLASRFTEETGGVQVPRSGSEPRLSTLILGGAQLGSQYGIANREAAPSQHSVDAVLRAAVAHGITHVDTAAAYGASESRIGSFLDRGYRDRLAVMTKIEPLGPSASGAAVRASLFRSMARLGMRPEASAPLDTLLLHRQQDAEGAGGVWDEMRVLQQEGLVSRVGVSVQNPGEAMRALELPGIDTIQLAFNLLDRRWDECRWRLRDSPVRVIARSVFLQGLLAGSVPAAAWPTADAFDPRTVIERLESAARSAGFSDVPALALAFARAQPWIDSVVIGCDSASQLDDLAGRFEGPPLAYDEAVAVAESLPRVPDDILDPSRWRRGDGGVRA